MTAYAAHLRVYEPLAAFAGEERARRAAYARGPGPTPEQAVQAERVAALRAAASRPVAVPAAPEAALVAELDGVTLVCPLRSAVRSTDALLDLRADLSDEVADAFVPRAVADQAQDDLERWREEHPELRVHVQSSTWQVPVRWFVLVDPSEREVRPGTPGQGAGAPPGFRTGRALLYRTPMSRARRRVARALSVLRRTVEDEAVREAVEDLGRWLEEFHPRSLVELDHGGLVHLLDDAGLAQEESARDVTVALAALGEGRTEQAAAAYARVSARMQALQAVESAN